jgi:hypothetical protein
MSTSAAKLKGQEIPEAGGHDVSSSRNYVEEYVSSVGDESDEDITYDQETNDLDTAAGSTQEDNTPVLSPEQTVATSKTRADGFVLNIFAVTSIHHDLLRCADLLSIGSDNATRATYHIQQYALTIRLNKLHRRWNIMGSNEWYMQVQNLVKRSSPQTELETDKFVVWEVLAEWFARFSVVKRGLPKKKDRNGANMKFTIAKRQLLKELDTALKAKKKACCEGLLSALLATNAKTSKSTVDEQLQILEKEVDRDCQVRGCLLGVAF